MAIDFDTLTECPNCGLEFNKAKPNYNFCSHSCYLMFSDDRKYEIQDIKVNKIPDDVLQKWVVKTIVGKSLWYKGYKPTLNWHRGDEEDEIWDEFIRLQWRDK